MARTLARLAGLGAATAAALAALAGPRTVFADEFSWAGNSGSWSVGSNWIGGAAPTGTIDADTLTFGVGDNSYVATLDPAMPNPFVASALSFVGSGTSSAITLNGGPIQLGGPTPQIVNQALSPTVAINVNNDLLLAGATELGGDGPATLNLLGAISGSGSLHKTGSGALMLGGNNSFDGGLDFDDGEIIVAAPSGRADITSFGAGRIRMNPGNQTLSSGTPATNVNVPNAVTLVGLGATRFTSDFTFNTNDFVLDKLNNVISRTLNVDASRTVIINAPIKNAVGAGTYTSLSKTGAGTLVLSGASTYAPISNLAPPSFTLAAGTVVITVDSDVDTSNTITSSPFGRQRLQLAGGTLSSGGAGNRREIANPMQWAGNFAISGKTLWLDGDAILTNDRSLTITNETDMFGSITQTNGGAGLGITKLGAGSLNFFKANTYRGDTNINEGVLGVAANGALGVSGGARGKTVVADGATLYLSDVSYTDPEPLEISGNGASGMGAVLADDGNCTYGGVTTFNGNTRIVVGRTRTLTFTNDVFTGGFSVNAGVKIAGNLKFNKGLKKAPPGPIHPGGVAGGLSITGGGRVTLEDVSDYDGETDVQEGSLFVNGALSSGGIGSVQVEPGALLGGTGVIGRPVSLLDAATLDPGDNVGSMTLQSLSLASATRVHFDLGAPSQTNADFVSVLSSLTLDGVLDVSDIGGFGPGVYPLMSYGTLIDNGMDVGSLPGGLSGSIVIDSADRMVMLSVVPEPGSATIVAGSAGALLLRRRRAKP